MTEILTESFCERCGTRYTFESARPRVRLKGVRVLSRGLKNFVLSDDTSIDEAMAAARSEADREASAHQLDAFHKTFNFCMSCRQYTCPNCWNESEARCLSCAPLALPEVSADIHDIHDLHELRQAVLTGEAAPGNGTIAAEVEPEHVTWGADSQPESPVEDRHEGEIEPAAVAAETEAPTPADVVAGTEAPVAAALGEPVDAADAITAGEPVAAQEPVAAAPDEGDVEDDAADKAASQTLGLLRRFRPGQSIDAELAAYERERDDAAATLGISAEPAAAAPTDDLAALQADRAAATAAAVEAATPAADEPPPEEALEPAQVETAEAEAPAAAAPIEPETVPEPEAPAAPPIAAAADVVEQPTWRITAPDPTGATPALPQADQGGSVPLQAGAGAPRPSTGEPQWPARPEWPAASASTAGLPFLGRPATPQGGMDALWAASNQELVTASPAPGKAAATGIQPCISCGLSLSATARFCRRCGTLQGR
jgi:hypothetical protein